MKNAGANIRVFIVDDHKVVIDGIKLMFETEKDIQFAGQAHNGKVALRMLEEGMQCDVVMMDINMPVMDGIEACRAMKKKYPDLKVLLLTMLKEVSTIKKSFKAGADGYLLKHEGKAEVLDAIRTVASGQNYHSDEVSRLVMSSLSVQKRTQVSPFPRISRREKQILKLIVDEYTTSEIANELFVSTHTVESHRKNLLMKLGARNTAGLVRIALEHALID